MSDELFYRGPYNYGIEILHKNSYENERWWRLKYVAYSPPTEGISLFKKENIFGSLCVCRSEVGSPEKEIS